MTLSRGLLAAALYLVCALLALRIETRGPSTSEERAKAVALTRSLERDPLSENAAGARQWLHRWIIEVPEIRVYVCDDLIGHGLDENYPYTRELSLQAMFAAAAFAIEHPVRGRDDIAQYHAGVEGVLRTYEVLRASKPDARSRFIDEFLIMRDRGGLADRVEALAREKCERSNPEMIGSLAGAGGGLVLALLLAPWFPGRRPRDGSTPRRSQAIVFACAAYYAIVGVALHALEPDYDPRVRFMSEYAWGNYGWLMTTTFFVLALAAFTTAAALRNVFRTSGSGRLGVSLLAVGALFVSLAGVFREFLVHFAASAVAIPSLVMAVLLLSWSFQRAEGWRPIYPATLVIALGMLAALLSIVANVGMPGLQQRAFLLLFLVWLVVVVHRLDRVTTRNSAANVGETTSPLPA